MRTKLGREQNARGRGGGVKYSPQFRSHQETKVVPVKLSDRHLQSHGQKGDETVLCLTNNFKI